MSVYHHLFCYSVDIAIAHRGAELPFVLGRIKDLGLPLLPFSINKILTLSKSACFMYMFSWV